MIWLTAELRRAQPPPLTIPNCEASARDVLTSVATKWHRWVQHRLIVAQRGMTRAVVNTAPQPDT